MSYHFKSEMTLNASILEVFSFFSEAENLEKITPPWLNFRISSPLPIEMKQGKLIDYRLSLYGISLHWQTVIDVWEPPYRFVDRQRKGPYKSWIHEHRFEEVEDGCLIKDHVQYNLYGGIFGSFVNTLFVKRDVERIFQYRTASIGALFDLTSNRK